MNIILLMMLLLFAELAQPQSAMTEPVLYDVPWLRQGHGRRLTGRGSGLVPEGAGY